MLSEAFRLTRPDPIPNGFLRPTANFLQRSFGLLRYADFLPPVAEDGKTFDDALAISIHAIAIHLPPKAAFPMDLDSQAHQLVERLGEKRQTLVLAESCTGGLISATLATVPGVSAWLAGSMVVYQEATKMRWLGVAEETLAQHTAVSAPVAHQMVAGALKQTPHADLAASITGHLGPNAPVGFDGRVFIGVGRRDQPPRTWQIELKAKKRVGRQREAALEVIATLNRVLGTV